MPRGVYSRGSKKELKTKHVDAVVETKPVIVPRGTETKKVEPIRAEIHEKKEIQEKPTVLSKCRPPHLASCQCQDALAIGQAYFEDGETGTVIIGDNTKNSILFRAGNGGKGLWINRKR